MFILVAVKTKKMISVMKKTWMLSITGFVCAFISCQPDPKEEKDYDFRFPPRDSLGGSWDIDYNKIYYCPVHPSQVNVYPGKCPICGTRMILKPEKDSLNLK